MTRHGCSEFSEQLVIIDCLGKSFYNGNDSFSVNAFAFMMHRFPGKYLFFQFPGNFFDYNNILF